MASAQSPVTDMLAKYSGATYADGKLSFPFTLGGTLQQPKFSLKSAGGAGAIGGLQSILGGKGQQTTAQPSEDLVKGISGLFKKKQTTQQPPAPQPQPK
jgi:hypothetical protein